MPEFIYRIQPTRLAMLTGGPTPEEQAVVAAHRAYLDRQAAAADAAAFGIVILRADCADTARRVMTEDPAVRAGVMRGELFPFRLIGVGSGLAAGA
jgi:uncharacterized protein YciI